MLAALVLIESFPCYRCLQLSLYMYSAHFEFLAARRSSAIVPVDLKLLTDSNSKAARTPERRHRRLEPVSGSMWMPSDARAFVRTSIKRAGTPSNTLDDRRRRFSPTISVRPSILDLSSLVYLCFPASMGTAASQLSQSVSRSDSQSVSQSQWLSHAAPCPYLYVNQGCTPPPARTSARKLPPQTCKNL